MKTRKILGLGSVDFLMVDKFYNYVGSEDICSVTKTTLLVFSLYNGLFFLGFYIKSVVSRYLRSS